MAVRLFCLRYFLRDATWGLFAAGSAPDGGSRLLSGLYRTFLYCELNAVCIAQSMRFG